MELIAFLEKLKKRRDDLMMVATFTKGKEKDFQLFELEEIIELLEKKISKMFSEQPKPDRYILYLYYIKNYTDDSLMDMFGLDYYQFKEIIEKFEIPLDLKFEY